MSSSFQSVTEGAGQTINKAIDGLFGLLKTVATTANEPLPADDLGITYITKRILVMGYPSNESNHLGRPIDNISHYLCSRYPGQFMVVNLSERTYDYSKFENQVLEFRFPGYPAPPLSTLFGMCNSIDHWLKADKKNVVAIHCQTGRGRTVCTVAAYMLWSGYLDNVKETCEYVALKLSKKVNDLLIPTQKRYLEYVSNMKQGRRPSSRVLKLQRAIMNGIPQWEDNGCTPYLQIFHNAKLLYTSTGREENSGKLRSYTIDDSSVLFPIDVEVEGDILIRIRHISPKTTKRASMLRFGFHTGYMRPGMHRFEKSEMDGACDNERFPNDFHLDLIVDNAEDELGNTRKTDMDRIFWDKVSTRIETPAALTPKTKAMSESKEPVEFRLFDPDDTVALDNNDSNAENIKLTDEENNSSNAVESNNNNKNKNNDINNNNNNNNNNNDNKESTKNVKDLDLYVSGLDEEKIDVDIDSDTEAMFDELSKELNGNETKNTVNNNNSSNKLSDKVKKEPNAEPIVTGTANDSDDDLLASLLAETNMMDLNDDDDDDANIDADLAGLEAALMD